MGAASARSQRWLEPGLVAQATSRAWSVAATELADASVMALGIAGDAVWSVAADAVVAKYELDKVRQPRHRQADGLRQVRNSFARRLRSRASALATRPCQRGPTAVSWRQRAGTARASTRSGVRLTCQRPAVHRVGPSPTRSARLSPRQRLHRRLCAQRRQPMRRGGQGRTRDRLGS